jgi:hypothetical protein
MTDDRKIIRTLGACSGACLLEAMIALTAGAVVLAAAVQSLAHFDRKLSAQQRQLAWQQDLRAGAQIFESELRAAGSGAGPNAAPLLTASAEEVVFLANLNGVATEVTDTITAGQSAIPVVDGEDWQKGKRILLCGKQGCEAHCLARDGHRNRLYLSEPSTASFQAGSTVFMSNLVRYYLRRDSRDRLSFMRQVDGGASVLFGGITELTLHYTDRNGMSTDQPARVAAVVVDIAQEGRKNPYHAVVWLRAE